VVAAARALVRGRLRAAAEHEMMAWYAAGYIVERIRARKSNQDPGRARTLAPVA
jgi:hypothetical protein